MLLKVPNHLKNFHFVVLVAYRRTKQKSETNPWNGFEILSQRKNAYDTFKFSECDTLHFCEGGGWI